LFLTAVWRRRVDVAALTVAFGGAWLLWSLYSSAARVAWFYDRLEHVRNLNDAGALPDPDYDWRTLPWKTASPRTFEPGATELTLVTNAEPYGYQAFASIETKRARSVDLVFDAQLESGGATIGFLQNGKWIASNSSQRPGRFTGANTAELGRSRSLTVVIANDNSAGESRLIVRSLRVYLRR